MTTREKVVLVEYYYSIINRVFIAEDELQKQGLQKQLKNKEITPEQYTWKIAEYMANRVE